MSKLNVSLAPGVSVEEVAGDVLVMVPGPSDVIRLQGDTADVVRRVSRGGQLDIGNPNTITELVRLGVLTSPTVSRRGFVKAGAIGAGAGIAVLAMPGVAAATSELPPVALVGNSYFTRYNAVNEGRNWLLGFDVQGYFYDLPPAPYDFPHTTENPSSLEVARTLLDPITATRLEHSSSSNYVMWYFDTDEVGTNPVPTLGDLFLPNAPSGTFTWDGRDYSVTFTHQGVF